MDGVTLIEEIPVGEPTRIESATLTPDLSRRVEAAVDELLDALHEADDSPEHIIALAKITAMTAHGTKMPLGMLRGLINLFYVEAWRGELPSPLKH